MCVEPRLVLESDGPAESVLVTRGGLFRWSAPYAGATSGEFGLLPQGKKGGVRIVHTLGFGSGRTAARLGRIPHVSGRAQCLQGLECSSRPTLGTA
jgi:hypothetical protein